MSADFGTAQIYKYAGNTALAQGRGEQARNNKIAEGLEREARSDTHLAAKNMKRMRQNQNAAMGAAGAARGVSGFSGEGSGMQQEIAFADALETAINDANLSNAINDANKRYEAADARLQGELSMMNARATAKQYWDLSKNALGSATIQTIATVVGGAMGAAGGAGSGGASGLSGGLNGAYNAYSLSGSANQMVPGSAQSSKYGDKLWANILKGM